MNRQAAIRQIVGKLERLDAETLEGLRVLVARLEPQLSASGLPYTGDPETDEVLDDPEVVRRIMQDKRGEVKTIPWERVKARQRAKRQVQ